jgi:hypothetical protein
MFNHMRKTISNYFYIYISVVAFMLPAIAHAQRVSINPTILNYNVSAGETSTQTITIINLSEQKQAFELSLGDWLRDSLGSHKYLPVGSTKNSCANWVKLDNNIVEVEAKQTKEVRITLNAPADPAQFKEMKWAMLFVQNVTEQAGDKAAAGKVTAKLTEVFRFGIHIYQTPPTVTNKEAKALSLKQDSLDKKAYNFAIMNTGGTQLTCKARLELTNIETGKEIKLEDVEFPVFPGAKRIVQLPLPADIPKGKYSMLALLDYDTSMPLEAVEQSIEIK